MSKHVDINDCPPEEITKGETMRAEDAVKALQELAGLKGNDVDGMFGKGTAEALANKFGDLTDPAVIAKQTPELQALLKAFDEGVNGSKGYFKKPEDCKIESSEGLMHNAPPAPETKYWNIQQNKGVESADIDSEGPKPRPDDLTKPSLRTQDAALSKDDFSITPKIAIAPLLPPEKEITVTNLDGQKSFRLYEAKPDMGEILADLSARSTQLEAVPDLNVAPKSDFPENLSVVKEPSYISAGGTWSGADGPNTSIGSIGESLKSAFSKVADVVSDVFLSPTDFTANTNVPIANETTAPPTRAASFGM